MKDIIFAILLFLLCIFGFNKLSKFEAELHEKTLKNELEKTKMLIEEMKK